MVQEQQLSPGAPHAEQQDQCTFLRASLVALGTAQHNQGTAEERRYNGPSTTQTGTDAFPWGAGHGTLR